MKARFLLLAIAGLAVTGCVSSNNSGPEVLAALDRQPDGYTGVYGSPPKRFTIRRSYVSQQKLCRVVVLTGDASTHVETFCKAKGGKWR
ncbi:hypothetical protein [Roseibium sp.]|uniref:hypothetical protein n=1 Tax=Roseibium sp. TaxID=1936156 RepID=UPI003A97BE74